MTISIYYNSRAHPAGYTDDLGIMSPENIWLEEEFAGWHAAFMTVNSRMRFELRAEFLKYCEEQNIEVLRTGERYLILDPNAVAMLLLRFPSE